MENLNCVEKNIRLDDFKGICAEEIKGRNILSCDFSNQADSSSVYIVTNSDIKSNKVTAFPISDGLKIYGDRDMCYVIKNQIEFGNYGFKCNVACNENGDWSIYFEEIK